MTLPPHPERTFAVVRVGNRQHKVCMNDRIMIELIDCEVGQQLCLEDVLLVGSADYTAIGRPQVNNARVYVTVEE